jgi:hypothetical protein
MGNALKFAFSCTLQALQHITKQEHMYIFVHLQA